MLRKIRIVLALVFFVGVTFLFLDFTGTVHAWLGWMAKIQFVPAVLALNFGAVAVLVLLTLVFGRIYCSVICPLGVMQDVIAWLGKKSRKNRYSYSPAKSWLRYTVLAVFIVAMIAGIGSLVALLEPYSIFGRIASNLLAPVYGWINNLFALIAERADSYAFYETEVWLRSLPTFIVAAVMLVLIFVLAWRNGRTWCNTVCPVGTFLSFLARFSWLKPVIDTEKCISCRKCERNCKASCIDISSHSIDYSRCVACMDCIGSCPKDAVSYRHLKMAGKHAASSASGSGDLKSDGVDASRRSFLSASLMTAAAVTVGAQEKKVDGGLAKIEDKAIPDRNTPVVPPGAVGLRHFLQHCTGCQLCVSVCPNEVLRPATDLIRMMQPEMSYERGYCRPECTKCSEVCPAGAILPIDRAEKSSIQIGHAVWVKKNCIPFRDGHACGNCARHCPTGAITMVPLKGGHQYRGGRGETEGERTVMVPAVNTERCIGCGACENLCPARPFTAIYVEGNEVHRTV